MKAMEAARTQGPRAVWREKLLAKAAQVEKEARWATEAAKERASAFAALCRARAQEESK